MLAGTHALSAADLPSRYVKAPLVTDPDSAWTGFYVWGDAAYEAVNLPRYNLGPATSVGASTVYGSQIINLDPHATGYSPSGGIGYYLPTGTLPASFGQNVRVELGGSYVNATASNSGSAQYGTPSGGGSFFLLMNNTNVFPSSYGCIGVCNSSSTLTTSYASWQVNGRVASDFTAGAFGLSPSFAVFGGNSRNDQMLTHVTNNGFMPTDNSNYTAATHLRWTDWGVKSGLAATFEATKALKLGLSGFIGVADRDTRLDGSDLFSDLPYSLGSTIGIGTSRAAFLANLEASVEYRPVRNVALKAFAGLDFDNSVPGIRAPSYNVLSSGADAIIPASINFQNETSYYAGGGVQVSFGP